MIKKNRLGKSDLYKQWSNYKKKGSGLRVSIELKRCLKKGNELSLKKLQCQI